MALSHVGNVGTATSTGSGTTLVVTTTADVAAGDALAVYVAWDNVAETVESGPCDNRIRCDDEVGNCYFTAASGQYAAGAGVEGAWATVFVGVIDTALPSGSDITITTYSANTEKAASVEQFTGRTKANLVVQSRSAPAGAATADPASITLSSLPSREYLLLHALATNGPSTDTLTQDADYTSITKAGVTGQTIFGGWRIATVTTDTIDVSIDNSRNTKQAYAAVFETDAPGIRFSATENTWATVGNGNISFTVGLTSETGWWQNGDLCVILGIHTTAGSWPGRENMSAIWDYIDTGAGERLEVYVNRMGSETSRTYFGNDVGDRQTMGAVFVYGVTDEQLPYELLALGSAAASTSVTVTGGTTTYDNELIMAIVGHGNDSDSASLSGWTNGNLVSITEVFDRCSSFSTGIGVAAAVGIKETAGATGNTTATLAASEAVGKYCLAFKGKAVPVSAAPFAELLDMATTTGAPSVSWSADLIRAGDIIVVAVETLGTNIATPTGYTEFPDSPQLIGTSEVAGSNGMNAFYKVATGSETSVTVADSGNHTGVIVARIRNADPDDPIDVTVGSTESASTTLTAGGDTTTVANTLVLGMFAHAPSTNFREFFTPANADLVGPRPASPSSLQIVGTAVENLGNGCASVMTAGVKTAAGSFGNTTITLATSESKAWVIVAFNPVPEPSTFTPKVLML